MRDQGGITVFRGCERLGDLSFFPSPFPFFDPFSLFFHFSTFPLLLSVIRSGPQLKFGFAPVAFVPWGVWNNGKVKVPRHRSFRGGARILLPALFAPTAILSPGGWLLLLLLLAALTVCVASSGGLPAISAAAWIINHALLFLNSSGPPFLSILFGLSSARRLALGF